MGRVLVQLPGSNTTKLLSETLPKNIIVVDEQLHQLRVHDGTTPGGHVIGDTVGSGVPIGTIIPFAGNSIPQGYLLCDGSAISRTNYALLFAVIGTIYGAGDGNTTFNLPSLIDFDTPFGITTNIVGYKTTGTLPNITGTWDLKTESNYMAAGQNYSGAIKSRGFVSNISRPASSGRSTFDHGIDFDANSSSSIYGLFNRDIVVPKGVGVAYLIKYI